MTLADSVFIRLEQDIADEELWRVARSFGEPHDVHVDRSRSPFIGYVFFTSFTEAAAMVGASPLTLDGHLVECQLKLPAPGRGLYMGNVDNATTEAELFQLCRVYGRINYISLGCDKAGARLPHAFVGFRHREAVDAAIAALDGQPLHGQTLRVEAAEKNRREVRPEPCRDSADEVVYSTDTTPLPTRLHEAPEHARPPRRKGSHRRRARCGMARGR